MKVVLITNTYAPYREPVWRALASMVDELHVVLMRETQSNRIWEMQKIQAPYTVHVLGATGCFFGGSKHLGLYIGGGVRKLLKKLNPTHLILAGYTAGPYVEAMFWAKNRKVPFVMWYESHQYSSYFKTGIVSFLRKYLLRRADAWCVSGQMSKDYLESMGIPANRITAGFNSVDTHKIAEMLAQSPHEIWTNRSGQARILFVGQFVRRKRVDLLLDAFSALPSGCAKLRLVGYGPLENELRRHAKGLNDVEFMPPTKTLESTVEHYLWADIVVMPSDREVWGLVINEALAAGCYVISSSLAGVTPDLVDNAPLDVGESIDPRMGAKALVTSLLKTINNIENIRRNRLAIAKWGQKFTPERTAKALHEALVIAKKSK